MLIDRAGNQVAATIYYDKTTVDAHKADVLQHNVAIVKANQAIDEQVAALRKSIADKGLELAKSTSDEDKTRLQDQIAKLNAQVAERLAARQPVIVLIGPTKFVSQSDAEDYVAAVNEAAKKAKAKIVTKSPETSTQAIPGQ